MATSAARRFRKTGQVDMVEPVKMPPGFVPLDVAGGQPQSTASPSALDAIYGPGYSEKRRKASQQAYGFQSETIGPVVDEVVAYPQSAIDWIYGQATGKGQPFGKLLDENLAQQRGAQDEYRTQHPYASIGANVLGGLAAVPTKGAAIAGAAPGLLARTGQAAKAGTAVGAGAGFAEGRGGVGGRARSAAGGAIAGGLIGGAIPGVTDIVRGVAGGVARAFNLSGRGASEQARRMFMDALKADGKTLADIGAITEKRPLTLADLGPNSRALLGKAYRASDEGRKIIGSFLDERSAGQLARMEGDIAEGLKVNPREFAASGDELIKARRANARTSYKEAYKGSVPVTDELRDLLGRAEKLGGVSAGKRLGEAEGIKFPDDPITAKEISVEALDYMTRGLKDIGPRGSNENRIASNIARQIDEAAPGLAAARKQYASDSALLEALEEGRKFMRGDFEDVGRAFDAMSPEEQNLYRLGAAREMLGKFSKVRDTNDRARFFENDDMRQRLRALFPDEKSFKAFMDAAADESAMNTTKNLTMRGSQTAERLADDSSFAKDVASAGVDIATGGGLASALRAATRAAGNVAGRMTGRLDDVVGGEVAKLGTRTDVAAMGPRLANLPAKPVTTAPAARVPVLGDVQAAPVQGAAGALVGRGIAPDQPSPQQPPAAIPEGFVPYQEPVQMPDGFAPLKSSMGTSEQTIAQAGATAPIAPAVGDVAARATKPMELARAFVGAGEANAARPLGAFIAQMTGKNIDIKETPWCAAFVNAVLKGSGSEGTGKLNARSFLDFGTATDKPQTGDVAVFWRENPSSWKGHVGFYAGEVEKNGQTYVRVVGGNQDNKVSEKLYPKAQLLGFRRPPTIKAA